MLMGELCRLHALSRGVFFCEEFSNFSKPSPMRNGSVTAAAGSSLYIVFLFWLPSLAAYYTFHSTGDI